VLEAGSGTKVLTISANPTLWTLFGSHKELGGVSWKIFSQATKTIVPKKLLEHILSSYIKTVHTENFHGWSVSLPIFDKRQPKNTQNNQRLIIYPLIPSLFDLPPFPTEFSGQR
jgi:hypothetical protein